MEEKKIDYLKEDPEVPNQQIALVSMIEPQNSRMLMNKESFLATKFIDKFLKDYIQARDYINKEGEDKMTDIIKEKLDLSYENVRDRYYDWKKISLNDHEKEFDKKYNENREPTVTGFKVRGAYPNILVAKEKAKELNKYEPFSDIYCIEVGKWTPYCPLNVHEIKAEYANEKLNELVNAKMEAHEKAKLDFEEDKQKKMDTIAKENEEKKKQNEKMKEQEPDVEEINDEDLLDLLEEEDNDHQKRKEEFNKQEKKKKSTKSEKAKKRKTNNRKKK